MGTGYPIVCGNEADGLFELMYEGTDGKIKSMMLDAETRDDAMFEAAVYLDTDESRIRYEEC